MSEMLLKHYDLTSPITEFELSNSGVNNTTVGVRTGEGDYVLKHFQVSHGIEGIQYEHDLLTWLAGQSLSFQVPASLRTRSGDTFYQDTDGYHTLTPLIEGSRPNSKDPAHTRSVGAALGELHAALADYPGTPRPHLTSFADLGGIHPRVPHPESLTPKDAGWSATGDLTELCDWWRTTFQRVRVFLKQGYPELPVQVIHGDYGPGNTLYHGDRISAVLDFEFVLPDIRIMDIASGLKFSMRFWENEDCVGLAKAFYRGYSEHVELTPTERAAIVEAMILLDFVSTIWWLGRHLADEISPTTERMMQLRDFCAWLETHRSCLENVWNVA
jgi:homoserine kinase type II